MPDLRDTARRPTPRQPYTVERGPPLTVAVLAAICAALFGTVGALHLGVSVGDVAAPRAPWVAPVELFCAVCFALSGFAVWARARLAREIALIANGVGLWSVLLALIAHWFALNPWTGITEIQYLMIAALALFSFWRIARWQRTLPWLP